MTKKKSKYQLWPKKVLKVLQNIMPENAPFEINEQKNFCDEIKIAKMSQRPLEPQLQF